MIANVTYKVTVMRLTKIVLTSFVINIHVIIPALLMLCGVQSLYGQQEHAMVSGKVVRMEDSVPVPGAHVINLTKERGTITGSEGLFSINVMIGDSIMFSAVGFKTDTIVITHRVLNDISLINVYLEDQLYDINSVDIYPLPSTYAGFKREFIHGFDSIPDYYSTIRDISTMPKIMDPSNVGVVGSPITWLYNRFSREGREMKNYHEILNQESMREGWNLNFEMVRQVTGLEEDEEILEFFAFCGFTAELLTTSAEFEVTEAIIECIKKYSEIKEDEIK